LDARQWREICGLRAKNEPLTTKTKLRRTARIAQQEEARYDNARQTQRTTKHAKDTNAGHPETTNAALPARSQDVKCAKHYEGKTLCRLTLELSGAGGVRLERLVIRTYQSFHHGFDEASVMS
jgi:hypothetical protein